MALPASRRWFLQALASASALPPARAAETALDRLAIVRRHNPVNRSLDPKSPLSVGNGEFAFTADITGLQTFPEAYKIIPLCTQSQWGWHHSPNPEGWQPEQLRLEPFDTHGRQVGYASNGKGQEKLFNHLRESPHRLNLARIGLVLRKANGDPATPTDLSEINQTLDLATGFLHSRFHVEGVPVEVTTYCHPGLDALAIRVQTDLPASRWAGVAFTFPYGSPDMDASDWNAPEKHQTRIERQTPEGVVVSRQLDKDRYWMQVGWRGVYKARLEGPHRLIVEPNGAHDLAFVCHFSPQPVPQRLTFTLVEAASRRHWTQFWSTGGAIDLSGSTDQRANELERRIVLSQYLTAIQCSGSMPPQETGLTCNSWYGKFHLEMHWWHAAHFPLWSRPHLLERSLAWYQAILPSARNKARQQGYAGARWPKMAGPDGRDSPSAIGTLLIWQQPHPIAMAELCYQSHPTRETLHRYRELVAESAAFMASYAYLDRKQDRYVLGPPVIPAQENHPPRDTWNPTFELEYWLYGLGLAQLWRKRLGLPPEPQWQAVQQKLSKLPVKDGVYLAHENCPQTFTERNRDHPSMLAAFGVLPGERVDRETMRRTLRKVFQEWRWPDTWGWDFPIVAMTAARLHEPELAIDALFIDSPKNTWFPNGHNWQRTNLPVYLPGNGGLLAAVSLMAAGWRGEPDAKPPGFPKKNWRVRSEGLRAWL